MWVSHEKAASRTGLPSGPGRYRPFARRGMVPRAPCTTRMRILFVASDRMEFPGLLGAPQRFRPTNIAVDWSRKALLNGNEALLVANGVGPARAGAATEAGIGAFDPDAIVSTGFCGALRRGSESPIW